MRKKLAHQVWSAFSAICEVINLSMDREHQAPWECVYAKEDKSDCNPGKRPKSDQDYFEILCLCILQAGLNWGVMRGNWEKYRKGFRDFSINRLARAQTDKLLKDTNVLKNKNKVAAILYNAQEFQGIRKEYGSFSNFLRTLKHMPNEEILKQMVKRFRHVGSYTGEYYLHSVGYWK